jgi:hypothetical protein
VSALGALRLAAAALVSAGGALALTIVSAAPFRVDALPDARLRVAFSARPERIEKCRTLSADELANVPQHMRQAVVCEGTTASYRLEVRRDDSLVASALVRGGGLRHDRRLYVLRELTVPSGRSTIDVRLVRTDTVAARPDSEQRSRDAREHDESAGHERRDARHEDHDDDDRRATISRDLDERRRRVADEVPSSLALHEVVTLSPREVLLVTYDQESRRLRTVRATP